MDKNNITSVKIPAGAFCGHNCSDGCIYWNPYDRDSNGRQYASQASIFSVGAKRRKSKARNSKRKC